MQNESDYLPALAATVHQFGGRLDRAERHSEKVLARNPEYVLAFQAFLGSVLARAGAEGRAGAILAELDGRAADESQYLPALFRATPRANLGRHEEALDLLEEGLRRMTSGTFRLSFFVTPPRPPSDGAAETSSTPRAVGTNSTSATYGGASTKIPSPA